MTKTFDPNDREAIRLALADPSDDDPLMRAISDKASALMKAVLDSSQKGSLPDRIEITKPATALDEAAIAVFKEGLALYLKDRAPVVIVAETARQ